jgi:peptidoglycan/xylan/chitin deacetylase (PgdA/CDA1 family)
MVMRSRGRRLTAGVAAGFAVLLAAGCAMPRTATPSSSHVQPTLASSSPAVARATGTPAPTAEASPTATTTTLTWTPPPAGKYPIVNSCDPKSVPSAIPVTTRAIDAASTFTLNVPVLMYHRVVPVAEDAGSLPGLVVPPETFDAQLTALANSGWKTITMATLADDLAAHAKLPARTVVITLDDGWYDGYTYALPILRSHHMVATFYVIASRIDQTDFLSTTQLRVLVAAGDDIGDHTMDHANLTELGASDLKYEIDVGASRIAQAVGRWPESLAYPSGYQNGIVRAAVAACPDLRLAVLNVGVVPATKPQGYVTGPFRFEVPRVRVTPGTSPATLLYQLGER